MESEEIKSRNEVPGNESVQKKSSDITNKFQNLKVTDYINTEATGKLLDGLLVGGASLLGSQIGLPSLNSPPGELIKSYILFVYVMSVMNGFKDVTLGQLSATKPDEPIDELKDFIKNRVLKIVNAMRPVEMGKKIFSQDKNYTSIFDHPLRFWTTRTNKKMVYDILSDSHFPIAHYPYHLVNLLLDDTDKIKDKTSLQSTIRRVENLSRRMFDDEFIYKAEFALILVLIMNADLNASSIAFENMNKMDTLKSKMKEIDWTMEEAHGDINYLLNVFYTSSYIQKKNYEGQHVAFRLLIDLLVDREDMLINWKDTAQNNFWSKLGYNRAGVFRCIRYFSLRSDYLSWDKLCELNKDRQLQILTEQ